MTDDPFVSAAEPLPPFRELTPAQCEMLELSPNPKLVLDRQFRIRFVNRVTMTTANVDRDALIGRNVWECYPDLRGSVFHEAYQRVLDTGEPARFERYDAAGDRWQSVYAFPADDGVVAVLEDITEQRRTIQRLRESEETLHLAQEAANIGSFHHDLRTGTTYWSDHLARINGFEPAMVDHARLGHDPEFDRVHPDDRERVHAAFRGVITHGTLQKVRLRIVRPDGTVRHLQTSMMLVRDRDEQPARVVGTALDITEQVEADAERTRIEARMQQAQKLESLGILAGGIAHDFNNLLVGILGNASLGMLEADDPQAVQECLREIERSAQRAAELTRQLLAYAGKGRYLVERADISRAIEEITVLLRSAVARTANLEYALAPGLPAIDVDLGQFRQVVMTLVTNASDALNNQAGTIQVQTGRQQVGEAYLKGCVPGLVATPGDFVYVEVRDTGSGMDAATRQRMFEPFFSTKFTGRGLGLAATLGIVRSHRGAIRVHSDVGQGTTMRLLFPVAAD
jgi:PAS domain S-box-containing protein